MAELERRAGPGGGDRPLASPVPPAAVERARQFRKARLVRELQRADCAAMLLYEPLNLRYALDLRSMQVWMLHHQLVHALLFADGAAIVFAYPGSEKVVQGLSTVTEVRPARAWHYSPISELGDDNRRRWADELDALLRRHGGANRRLALDRLDSLGVASLRQRGVELLAGQHLLDRARAIKSPDEVAMMRFAIEVAERGMARMRARSEPGRSEQEIWAELHHENIRSGGEWCETRLVLCGQHSNPWFQEAGDYACRAGELLSFDTDLVGPHGYSADLSRSWTIGGTRLDETQRRLYAAAREQVEHNLALIRPGLGFAEFNEKSWRVPEPYQARRYSVAAHGVGMSDEWPWIPLHTDWTGRRGALLPGMTLCIESLIGEAGGKECVKLEAQVLVTETGCERLDSYPWEEV